MRTRIGFVDGLMANKKSWAIGAALFVGALAGKQGKLLIECYLLIDTPNSFFYYIF